MNGPEMQIKVCERYENDDLNDAYSIRAANYQPDQIEMRVDMIMIMIYFGYKKTSLINQINTT